MTSTTRIESGDIVERDGRRFRVEINRDEDIGAPWDEHDGHGVVSGWERRSKRPGELILCEDHGSCRFYDVQASTEKAIEEGWDAEPYGGSKGERAARAVRADYEHLRRWCNDEWWWVYVLVTEICTCSKGHEHDGDSRSLGGIESDAGDYFTEVANELIDELMD